jgi:mannose-6-phosphate isomerase-like protein (cupin superfamily)
MTIHRPRMVTPRRLLVATAIGIVLLVPDTGQPQVKKDIDSGLVRADDAIPTRGPWGEWRRHFRGDTHGTRDLIVLAVHLKPGHEPHPPHRHAEEEVMILAEGTGVWQLGGKEQPARKGDVVYAAPWVMHGVRNTGDGPLTYYMVKWSGKGVAAPPKAGQAVPVPKPAAPDAAVQPSGATIVQPVSSGLCSRWREVSENSPTIAVSRGTIMVRNTFALLESANDQDSVQSDPTDDPPRGRRPADEVLCGRGIAGALCRTPR